MALRDINLLPDDMVYPVRAARHLTVWGTLLAVLLLLAGCGYAWLAAREHARARQAGSPIADEHEVAALRAELQAMRTEQDEMLSFLALRRGNPATRVIATLARCLNDHTWLTKLALTRATEDDGTTLGLSGLALSGVDLEVFQNRMDQDPSFSHVVLLSKEEDGVAGALPGNRPAAKLIRFRIECNVRARPEEAGKSPAGAGSTPAQG